MKRHSKIVEQFLLKKKKKAVTFFSPTQKEYKLFQKLNISITRHAGEATKDDLKVMVLGNKYYLNFIYIYTVVKMLAPIGKWSLE